MCTCTHGADRHYLDYAGPGVAGGILTRCLQEGCECILFVEVSAAVFVPCVIVTPVQIPFSPEP
mgnify:CR=1 FL=1